MISIISDNCWGMGVYKYLNVKYYSPFVNTYIYPPDFLKLVENFPLYMKEELVVPNDFHCSYCKLGNIEIQFPHYKDGNELIEIWKRRKERIDMDNLLFKIGDIQHEEFRKKYNTYENDFYGLIKRFHEIKNIRGVSFTHEKLEYNNNFLIHKEDEKDAMHMGYNINKYFNIEDMI